MLPRDAPPRAAISITAREAVLAAMREQARLHFPQECCGVLAGAGGVVTELFPITNALASPRRYFADPAELIRVFRAIRQRGLLHLGLYHSHPAGDIFPSPSDVEMAFYPDCAYFIVSPRDDLDPPVRAFRIQLGQVAELAIKPATGE